MKFAHVPKVTFEMESVTVEIPQGQTVYDAANQAGIVLQRGFAAAHPCGGKGFCSGTACAIFLRTKDPAAVSSPTWREKLLHRRLFKGGKRLACQCVPQRDLTVVTMP
jgi:ferredoxin